MKKIFLLFFPLLLLTFSTASAEDEKKIDFGGSLRLRSETRLNYQATTARAKDNDSSVLLRARVHADVTPIEHLRIFFQPQFSRTFAQEGNAANNGSVANAINVDDFDLHQAYIAFENIADSKFSVYAGRQELSYGDDRLIGNFDWDNVGRAFDALKLRYKSENIWVDTFGSVNVKSGPNQYLAGMLGGWTGWKNHSYEDYLLYYHNAAGSAAGRSLDIVTVGALLKGNFGGGFDYGVEAAGQFGKSQPNNHAAYAGHAQVGYTFAARVKPRIGLEYNHASGDDPNTATVERFNNLFPTNHNKYGYMDFVSWRNIHDLSANVSIKPTEKITLSSAYHFFLLPEVTDGLFAASGAQLRAGAVGASGIAGHEIDLLGKYVWNKYADFLLGYSYFRAGDFFADTGGGTQSHFVYLQTTAKF
ncbi:MAG: hypothetical protein COV43_03725 [Deltaproteobacteria bacterium CG11_big_fil_rev_8_21_14_0_20_42_23]|nr:MAG: hypothetical protein COV43_03725 [Deltaproteobacteria bacterium CG11_big_fil_rev_8_21_14_0_20_42_23]PJC64832.1 MAG: hypothetical protein CO021_02335 [Deltaproteobacteria bacterium CG_4_9_14_0_2_um_filter_42_21]